MPEYKNIYKRTGRILLKILLGVFMLILAAMIFVVLPVGKNVARNQIENYLTRKFKTKVEIGSVDYSLPKWLKLKNVYLEDQRKDTLLFGEELSVDLDMIKLMQGNTDIHKLYFKNMFINVNRPEKDSFFNYQFIVNAFTGNKSTTAIKDTAELKLTLDRLIFDNVALHFKDDFLGNTFKASIRALDVTNKSFQPDRVKFGIDEFYASGVKFHMTTVKNLKDSIEEFSVNDSVNYSPYKLFITANRLQLRDVDVVVDNKFSGLFYSNNITKFYGTNMLYSYGLSRGTADSLLLDSSAIVFSSAKQLAKPVTAAGGNPPLPWYFAAKQLNIKNTAIKFDDVNVPLAGGLDFSHLETKKVAADISHFLYTKDSAAAIISQLAFSDKSGFELDTTHVKLFYTDTIFSASDLYIKTPRSVIQNLFELRYDSIADITKRPKNTLLSALLNGTVLSFNDLYLIAPSLQKTFPKSQFANQYVNINTELRGNLQRLYLPYLQLSGLSGSKLNAKGTLYNLTDPNTFSYDLYIFQSNIFKKDLLRFVPPENQKQLADLPALINLRGKITGNKNSLIGDVSISAKDLAFTGRVNLTNITDPAKIKYDLAFTNASFNKNLIAGYLPPAVLQQLALPARINAAGKFSGDKNNITANLRLSSGYGPLTVKGYLKNIQDPQRVNYDLYITTPGFALGKLIKDTLIGNVAGNFIAKGTGFDYKTMRSKINADIASLQYNKYNYRNALIDADFSNGLIKSIGKINDSSLRLNYKLEADVRRQYPSVSAAIHIDTAQLHNLHLTKDTLNFSLDAVVNAKSLQPRNLDANFFLDSIKFQSGKNGYRLDSISMIASSANGVDSIILNAPFADVHAGGAFDYDKIGPAVLQYVNNYYKIPGYTASAQKIPDQQFAIKGEIKQSPVVKGLIPGLGVYDDLKFAGSFNSAETDSALNFKATIKKLVYTSYRLTNGDVSINSRNGKINYDVKFDTLKTAGNILYGTVAKGAAAKDSLSVNVFTKDKANRKWFELAGAAFVKDDTYTFRLQDTLMLNYERWKVEPGNFIQYSPAGIVINHFHISSDTAKISFHSQQLIPGSPIDIDVENFNLKSVSSFVNKDTILVAGVVDMKATVSDLQKQLPSFTGTASVTDFQYMQHPLGNITATARKNTDTEISAEIKLTGAGNDLSVNGKYYPDNEQKQFDAEMQIRELNFRTVEAFSAGQLQHTSGNISGNLNLSGKIANPQWKGEIAFDTAQFELAKLGTPYRIDKQKIIFDYPLIKFNRFTIEDSLNHTMTLNGDITSKSLMSYDLDLDVNARNFAIVNAKKAINREIYGFAAIDANARITGSSAKPNIEGDVLIKDSSNLIIILPEASYAKDDGKLIVRFIDRDTFQINPPAIAFEPEQKPADAFAEFINYNLNLELTKAAALTIIIDPVTGDEIKVQGDAKLNAGVDPGGNLVLSGVYELDKGYYDLHYGFLERKFNLIKGSTITFAGTPLNATTDITAEYIAYTSAKDLLTNEVTDVSPTLSNSFNQKLRFRVMLYLTGPLNKPDIKFDIQLPEQSNLLNNDLNTTIENKLLQIRSDPAAINKQVFSLLLFNRFVSEQSSDFFRGNGGDFNDLARQSVSQFLSSALNEIASDLFKGIDVDLNLNSYNDFSNGGNAQRTDLNVAVSKAFANDRLVVSVGTNIGVQGQDAATKASGANTGFKPDVTVSYKLTTDGRYLLRAYTKNQFEVVLDGYVVETGLAFVVTMDYDKFKELFRRKKKATPAK